MFRNLILAFCIVINLGQWLSARPDWREWSPKKDPTELFFIEEFTLSHTVVYTNVYLINHWWMAIIQMSTRNFFLWFDLSSQRSDVFLQMLLLTVQIWFGKAKSKPPDKREKVALATKISDWFHNCLFELEDCIYYIFKINVNLSFWIPLCYSIITTYYFELIQNFISIDSSEELETPNEWKEWQSDENIECTVMNKLDPFKFRRKKLITSNLVFSMSAKTKRTTLASSESMDTDSYLIAIDTCTSETIVKHRELFIGEIKPCKNLFVQGVGGSIKASGYGTIKVRVTCDRGRRHDLIIHNVIYLPESPVNLLSPQKWAAGSTDPTGTGEVTVGDTTLLFWNERRYTKLIPHHPELGIPIMSVNDGYTKAKAFMHCKKAAELIKPCFQANSFHTSQVVISEKDKVEHIIPIEDDDEIIQSYPAINETTFNPLVDDLENMKLKSKLDTFNDDPSVCSVTDGESSDDSMYASDEESTVSNQDELVEMSQNEIEEITASISDNVTKDQRELLAYHYKLKHLPFAAMKRLAEKGVIPKRLASVDPPLCYPCQLGKQHKRPWRGKGKGHKHSICRESDSFPGARTSVDQMVSHFGGLIPQIKGRLMKAKYYGATIFVDHFTDYTYVHLMKDATAESTLEAKNAYEHLLHTFGHKVLAYHADNGRFAETVFMGDVKDKAQNITFCGVGSHHQNGIAERKIRTLGEDARTMLAHGEHLWPGVVTKSLWPFAYKAACRIRNKFKLDDNLMSPEEKLTGVRANLHVRDEHPLFCPVFVLDKKLQGSLGGIPKWNPRANAGVYLGHSPDHASNVALVLNLATGLVSPQFHVVFDDEFSTVDFIKSKKEPSNWEHLCRYYTEDYRMDPLLSSKMADDLQLNLLPSPPKPTIQPTETPSSNDKTEQPSNTPSGPPTHPVINQVPPATDDDQLSFAEHHQEGESGFEPVSTTFDEQDTPSASNDASLESQRATSSESFSQPEPMPTTSSPLRRSSRQRKPVDRLTATKLGELAGSSLVAALDFISSYFLEVSNVPSNYYCAFKADIIVKIKAYEAKVMHYDEAVELNVDGTTNYQHPLSFAVKKAGVEVYHFHQAMREDDREDFIKAMIKELEDFQRNKFWKLVKRSEIGDSHTIKAIWSFKRKRRPDGSLLKHKARLCAHGGMQIHGENYWDTYAPVVQWISIRMMLTISVIHDLYTTSIDFTLAFPQAETDVQIFMEIPLGCEVPEGDYVCELLKNVYGLKQAAKTWFEYLRDTLVLPEEKGGFGFKQSLVDPCVFYKEGVTLISWVDDCLIFAREKHLADKLIKDLQRQFTLSEEDDVSAYLGVKMEIDKDNNTVTMSQPFLIDRIINLLGDAVKESNVKDSPAVYKEYLHKDEAGPDRKQDWNYRSAIGMLNYLAASTRPDCLYAVHQCARFSSNPKLSHERAVKRIVRYLKGTRDKGLILHPDASKGVQCYVDADFAGGYTKELSNEPISVFSRTGYVIYYFNCPVIWVSKMQSEICLSTVEAEYVALSQAMRDIIPFMDHIEELDTVFGQTTEKPVINCTLFEDNNGALDLAMKPKYRPRTKHIAIKYHHFREHIKTGRVTVQAIDTHEQIADQFTKALPSELFKYLRGKLLGW